MPTEETTQKIKPLEKISTPSELAEVVAQIDKLLTNEQDFDVVIKEIKTLIQGNNTFQALQALLEGRNITPPMIRAALIDTKQDILTLSSEETSAVINIPEVELGAVAPLTETKTEASIHPNIQSVIDAVNNASDNVEAILEAVNTLTSKIPDNFAQMEIAEELQKFIDLFKKVQSNGGTFNFTKGKQNLIRNIGNIKVVSTKTPNKQTALNIPKNAKTKRPTRMVDMGTPVTTDAGGAKHVTVEDPSEEVSDPVPTDEGPQPEDLVSSEVAIEFDLLSSLETGTPADEGQVEKTKTLEKPNRDYIDKGRDAKIEKKQKLLKRISTSIDNALTDPEKKWTTDYALEKAEKDWNKQTTNLQAKCAILNFIPELQNMAANWSTLPAEEKLNKEELDAVYSYFKQRYKADTAEIVEDVNLEKIDENTETPEQKAERLQDRLDLLWESDSLLLNYLEDVSNLIQKKDSESLSAAESLLNEFVEQFALAEVFHNKITEIIAKIDDLSEVDTKEILATQAEELNQEFEDILIAIDKSAANSNTKQIMRSWVREAQLNLTETKWDINETKAWKTSDELAAKQEREESGRLMLRLQSIGEELLETARLYKEAGLTRKAQEIEYIVQPKIVALFKKLSSNPDQRKEIRKEFEGILIEHKEYLSSYDSAGLSKMPDFGLNSEPAKEAVVAPLSPEELKEKRLAEIVKELEARWEEKNGPMERSMTEKEIKEAKEWAETSGKEWDGSTTRLTEKGSEFYFDHKGKGRNAVPKQAKKILAERYPEYKEDQKPPAEQRETLPTDAEIIAKIDDYVNKIRGYIKIDGAYEDLDQGLAEAGLVLARKEAEEIKDDTEKGDQQVRLNDLAVEIQKVKEVLIESRRLAADYELLAGKTIKFKQRENQTNIGELTLPDDVKLGGEYFNGRLTQITESDGKCILHIDRVGEFEVKVKKTSEEEGPSLEMSLEEREEEAANIVAKAGFVAGTTMIFETPAGERLPADLQYDLSLDTFKLKGSDIHRIYEENGEYFAQSATGVVYKIYKDEISPETPESSSSPETTVAAARYDYVNAEREYRKATRIWKKFGSREKKAVFEQTKQELQKKLQEEKGAYHAALRTAAIKQQEGRNSNSNTNEEALKAELFQTFVVDELQNLDQERFNQKSILGKLWEKYQKMPVWKRRTISFFVFALISGVATGGVSFTALGLKALYSGASAGLGEVASARLVKDKTEELIEKQTETHREKAQEMASDILADKMDEISTKYLADVAKAKHSQRHQKLKKAGVKILVSSLTTGIAYGADAVHDWYWDEDGNAPEVEADSGESITNPGASTKEDSTIKAVVKAKPDGTETSGSPTKMEAKAGETGTGDSDPAIEPTSSTEKIANLATVRPGDGISQIVARVLRADPDKMKRFAEFAAKNGFEGKPDTPAFYKFIMENTGYMNADGGDQIRLTADAIGKTQYVPQIDDQGKMFIQEIRGDDIENHAFGAKFENSDFESDEYVWGKSGDIPKQNTTVQDEYLDANKYEVIEPTDFGIYDDGAIDEDPFSDGEKAGDAYLNTNKYEAASEGAVAGGAGALLLLNTKVDKLKRKDDFNRNWEELVGTQSPQTDNLPEPGQATGPETYPGTNGGETYYQETKIIPGQIDKELTKAFRGKPVTIDGTKINPTWDIKPADAAQTWGDLSHKPVPTSFLGDNSTSLNMAKTNPEGALVQFTNRINAGITDPAKQFSPGQAKLLFNLTETYGGIIKKMGLSEKTYPTFAHLYEELKKIRASQEIVEKLR